MANRFSSLKVLRQERLGSDENEPIVDLADSSKVESPSEEAESSSKELTIQVQETKTKRPIGRPPGRRSNPDYTQISAYIPIDILQEVQDILAQERRKLKTRTPRPVSDLVEELLDDWLKLQKSKLLDK